MKRSTHIASADASNGRTPALQPWGKAIGRAAQNVAAILLVAAMVSGCGSMAMKESRQNASLVDYVYSGQQAPDKVPQASITELNLPMRIGVAFVPGIADPKFGISEVEQLRWLTQIKSIFEKHTFVGEVVVIPTSYLRSGGGFDNLRQVAKLFNVDAMALVSYDQTQYSEPSNLSLMYWTGIGAYVVPGDHYDIHTVLETAVFDVKTQKLLFRAPATSTVKGSATWVGFVESSRQARSQGFDKAFQQLAPNVDTALQIFHKQAQNDPAYRLTWPEGYDTDAQHRLARETARH